MIQPVTQAEMEERLVRYSALRPCTTAFIDTRTPGSERKENFTIIGPGVAENPEQFVHICVPHGFNIGAARQPPRCVNSQHSHETAEVFIVHAGNWRFKTGHDGTGPHIDLGPGDTISLPPRVFRGFENIGTDLGFMFSVLGGDDPGRVTWAPYVFEQATRYGLALLESGRLIDTFKESVPTDERLMRATTLAELDHFMTITSERLAACVLHARDLSPKGGLSSTRGFEECPIIGVESPSERIPAGKMGWPHGFQVRALRIAPGGRSPPYRRLEEEVLLVHAGRPYLEWSGGRIDLGPGDTLTVPKNQTRILGTDSSEDSVIYVVRGGDYPKSPESD